jgi:nitrogen fixation protein FixH
MSEAKRSKVVYIFFAFFAVIFAVNFFYIYLSKKTWSGVATEDSYQKGLNYNGSIKAVERQKELGWVVNIGYRSTGEKKAILMINPQDKNYRYIRDAEIYVNFKRPTQEGLDFTQKVEFLDGVYQAKIEFPLPGQWDAEIVVRRGQDVFQEVKRYVVQ